MDKAVLYLRLSKEDTDKETKEDDSESINNQRLLLTDYALKHNMKIVEVYSDDDFSGMYDDRPAFTQMMKDAKLGKFNVVLAKTQSRFTRNMESVERYLHHDFPLLGIRFIGVVDGVDTMDSANKKSRQISGLVNEWYIEDLSNNIRSVFRKKMENGQFLGGFAPYGYIKNPKDKYQLLVDDEAAKVVKRIYRLFMEGYSVKAITHILEDDNIPNPSKYKEMQGLTYKNSKAEEFSIKYGLWSETTVKRILTNSTYIGDLNQGTFRKESYKDKKLIAVPKEEWVTIHKHHEAIIDDDTFFKVQALRKSRRVCRKGQGKDKKVHVFSGKLRCSDCGHTIIKTGPVRNTNDDWYMRCQLANKSRGKECTSHNIRYKELKEVVLLRIQQIVDSVLNNDDNIAELLQYADNGVNDRQKMIDKVNSIDRKINTVTESAHQLYLDRVDSKISEDMFFSLKDKFEKELDIYKEEKKKLQMEIDKMFKKTNKKQDVKAVVKKRADYSKLTYDIVNDFIDYIEIGEKNKETGKQEVIIHWNF